MHDGFKIGELGLYQLNSLFLSRNRAYTAANKKRLNIMWVVRCSITGEYLLNSSDKEAVNNKTNIKYAKMYSTLSGAKSARRSLQSSYDVWYDTQSILFDRGIPEYVAEGRDHNL